MAPPLERPPAGPASRPPTWFVVGALAVVPVVAIVWSLLATWRFRVTVSDTAWLTQRVADAARLRWPLVGMPSSIGRGRYETHHPGPVQFYWLAPWWRALGFRGIVVGTAVGNGIAIWALGGLARRVAAGSMWAAVLTQVVVAGSVLSVSSDILADPFNPFVALVPAAACTVGAIGVVRRVEGGWPALLVAGSLAAQLHVGFLPWVAAMVVVAVVGVTTLDPPEDRPRFSPRADRWHVRGAGVLLFAMWLPPLIDQMGGTGNIGQLARAAFATDGATAGLRPAIVSAGVAIDPWHGTLDGPWIPIALTGAQWGSLVLAVAAGAGAVALAPRGHWCRAWLGGSAAALVVWTLLASRALPFRGLLPSPYVRTLWPLGALWWVGAAAGVWARVPAGWWRSPIVPVAVAASWVATLPTGTIGLDPATRVRAAEIVDAVARFRPGYGVNVTARNHLTGWFFAPAVGAELDRRGIRNGVADESEWDAVSMTDRPTPLRGTTCRLLLADTREAAPFLSAEGVVELTRDDPAVVARRTRRRDRLAIVLDARFGRLHPSPLARAAAASAADRSWWGDDATSMIRSGSFADLAANGMIAEVSMRDPEVAEFVELDHLLDEDWSGVRAWAVGC